MINQKKLLVKDQKEELGDLTAKCICLGLIKAKDEYGTDEEGEWKKNGPDKEKIENKSIKGIKRSGEMVESLEAQLENDEIETTQLIREKHEFKRNMVSVSVSCLVGRCC